MSSLASYRHLVAGTMPGRCPLSGQFLPLADTTDDEPLEHGYSLFATPAATLDVEDEEWLDYGFDNLCEGEIDPIDPHWVEARYRLYYPELWQDAGEDDTDEPSLPYWQKPTVKRQRTRQSHGKHGRVKQTKRRAGHLIARQKRAIMVS